MPSSDTGLFLKKPDRNLRSCLQPQRWLGSFPRADLLHSDDYFLVMFTDVEITDISCLDLLGYYLL